MSLTGKSPYLPRVFGEPAEVNSVDQDQTAFKIAAFIQDPDCVPYYSTSNIKMHQQVA